MCFGIGFQGSGPHAPVRSIWHPVSPCLYFPPSSSLGPSPYWLVTERRPVDAAAWVLVNYSSFPDGGALAPKEETVLFRLHLHTCRSNSVLKSDNKSMVPRGDR